MNKGYGISEGVVLKEKWSNERDYIMITGQQIIKQSTML